MDDQDERVESVRYSSVRNLRPKRSPEETIQDSLGRIDELERHLETIAQRLEHRQIQDQPGLYSSDRLENLTDEAQEAVNEAIETLRGIAGIELPEDRSQRFLKAIDVYRLQEYHEDESYFLALASLSGGAALGVLVNWATAEIITLGKAGWVALIVFGLVTVVFGLFWVRAHRRSAKLELRAREIAS